MKFDLVSDLHVEFNQAWDKQPSYDGISRIYPWHLEKQSDVLVIAGDCSNDPFTTIAVVDEAIKFYDTVIFTDGNHEHYTGRKNRADTRGNVTTHNNLFRRYTHENEGTVVFLEPGSHYTWTGDKSTRFIGANGWYDFTAHSWLSREQQHTYWKNESNDSRQIEFAPNGYPDKLAQAHADWLRQAVIAAPQDGVDELVVITHTIPHRVGMFADNHPWGHLNGAYMNTFMQSVWMADEANLIKAWCFGHTHTHCDDVREGIRFINNARGYFAYRQSNESGYVGLKQVDTQASTRSAFDADPQ